MLNALIQKQSGNLASQARSTSQVDIFDFLIHSVLDTSLAEKNNDSKNNMSYYRQNIKMKGPEVIDIPHLWDMTARNFGEKMFEDSSGDGIEILIESVTKQDSLKYRY